jgi:ApbE superfamily uncharacterized protein (UPF0280 family)
MRAPPVRQELSGERLHFQHGPIDLVLKAWGEPAQVRLAGEAAWARFHDMLRELAAELEELRKPMDELPVAAGRTARRMIDACSPFEGHFITPMAAVAGAVADETLQAMTEAAKLDRAFVNDGGDIALHLAPGHSIRMGVMGDFSRGDVPLASAGIVIRSQDAVRGVATSGARGRSFSLGIADSVTVLARSAALADAAATLIGNAVDCADPGIRRQRAAELDPDSDLGDRLVTVVVPPLDPDDIDAALSCGIAFARGLLARGVICDASVVLQGRTLSLNPSQARMETAS